MNESMNEQMKFILFYKKNYVFALQGYKIIWIIVYNIRYIILRSLVKVFWYGTQILIDMK